MRDFKKTHVSSHYLYQLIFYLYTPVRSGLGNEKKRSTASLGDAQVRPLLGQTFLAWEYVYSSKRVVVIVVKVVGVVVVVEVVVVIVGVVLVLIVVGVLIEVGVEVVGVESVKLTQRTGKRVDNSAVKNVCSAKLIPSDEASTSRVIKSRPLNDLGRS